MQKVLENQQSPGGGFMNLVLPPFMTLITKLIIAASSTLFSEKILTLLRIFEKFMNAISEHTVKSIIIHLFRYININIFNIF